MSGSPSESFSYGGGTTVPESDHCCDWISTLPDAILCFILSFLPTKQVIATSVLSKRWQPLWRSVSTLDFEVGTYYNRSKEDYARLLHSVSALIQHLHHPIHKFRIRCCQLQDSFRPFQYISPFTDPAHVTKWVNAAVQRGGLQHLHLCLSSKLVYREPPINLSTIVMFSCKTLVVLKLEHIWLEPISSVDLPLLKVMHLYYLTFAEPRCLAKLLSGCPILEDFKEFKIRFEDGEDDTETEFKTMPKLLRADIYNFDSNIMLKVVNNVKFLHIDRIEESLVHDTEPYDFPMFHNLTHMQLDYIDCNIDWSDVVELIKNCPKLQVLVIYQPEETANWQYPPSILHLQRCTKDDEFKFARYIAEDSNEDDNMQWDFYKLTSSQLELVDESSFYYSSFFYTSF
ncbi:FBD-associated F-box protein At5g56370-like [Lotus japonicus]|uniref:FBD-associated F-box protein At5g56370-like n=1 Tax=Lotus japonicus TaxID=34305 RepID=UPI002587E4FB|nr:FBD-associated F-box protein At5g56370-like [Lotus japonicus]